MIRLARCVPAVSLTTLLAVAPAAAESWQIDAVHSTAQFSVTHNMIATVRGEFSKMSGMIDYDGASVESIGVNVTIEAASINTRNDKRDGHLKSEDFFDVAKYPTITFRSKKAVAGTGGTFKLVGDLTMHGVTKEVTLDAKGPSKVVKGGRGESRVAASASTTIDRQDFGVKWNSPLEGGGVVVSDAVAITIDIEAVLPPPAAAPASPPK